MRLPRTGEATHTTPAETSKSVGEGRKREEALLSNASFAPRAMHGTFSCGLKRADGEYLQP